MTDIAIQATNLCFKYPKNDFRSLDGVSFQIAKGSCTGLIGPNGAGKSTLLSALTGLLQPQQGKVEYPLYPKLLMQEIVREKVALVPQNFAFYEQLSVEENLKYFAGLTRLRRPQQKQAISLALSNCQLNDLAGRLSKQLSGGNKRKLNLAIALLKDPEILFLDEPTVGVDPVSRASLIQFIKSLKDLGKTIIYTSHMLNEVQAICDHVYVMNQGVARRFDAIQNYRLEVIFKGAIDDQQAHPLSAFAHIVEMSTHRLLLQPSTDEALRACLLWLGQSNLCIKELQYQPNSLTQFYNETFS